MDHFKNIQNLQLFLNVVTSLLSNAYSWCGIIPLLFSVRGPHFVSKIIQSTAKPYIIWIRNLLIIAYFHTNKLVVHYSGAVVASVWNMVMKDRNQSTDIGLSGPAGHPVLEPVEEVYLIENETVLIQGDWVFPCFGSKHFEMQSKLLKLIITIYGMNNCF